MPKNNDYGARLARLCASHQQADLYIDACRRRSPLHRHLLSLPSRLMRAVRASQIMRLAAAMPDVSPQTPCADGVVVSLTSFPARIGTVHMVIRSLLLQTVRPAQILLYLSAEEFPQGIGQLPPQLAGLDGRHGVSIRFVDGNLRSHKKYFYAFAERPDACVITVDDDLYYPPHTIARLVDLHRRFPKAVCANVVRRIALGPDGRALPYRRWPKLPVDEPEESAALVGVGYGGVLYPPRRLAASQVLRADVFMSICPIADDQWLKACELSVGVAVASGGEPFGHPAELPGSQRRTLQSLNMSSRNQNNVQWQSLDEHFGLSAIIVS